MTAEELDAEVAPYDQPFVADRESRPLTRQERAKYRKTTQGRRKACTGNVAKRIQISVESDLLRRADQYARRHRMSRSEMIARGLETMLTSAA